MSRHEMMEAANECAAAEFGPDEFDGMTELAPDEFLFDDANYQPPRQQREFLRANGFAVPGDDADLPAVVGAAVEYKRAQYRRPKAA